MHPGAKGSDYPQTNVSVLAAIVMWISGGGRIRLRTLIKLWIPDYSWQLGLGLLRFKFSYEGRRL